MKLKKYHDAKYRFLFLTDRAIKQYYGKWVAVHKGKVVAVAEDLVKVAHAALTDDGYAYCNLVGREDEVIVRKRRVEAGYDETYQPYPLPRLRVRLLNPLLGGDREFHDVIPDTGADLL